MRYCGIIVALGFALTTGGLRAEISVEQALQKPAVALLSEMAQRGRDEGWEPVAEELRHAAQGAYGKNRLDAAEAWLYAARWAELFSLTEKEFIPGWMKQVDRLRVGHPNMATRYELKETPLAALVAPALQTWLITHAEFSDEFFNVLSPVDYLPTVLGILNELYGNNPAVFSDYASLALAIAVVYDVPPPPNWPHGQVSASQLPRRWRPVGEVFRFFVAEDRAGRTYQRLNRLGADELKFVVDIAASPEDLKWSQQVVNVPLNQFEKAYPMVRYRLDRVMNQRAMWTENSYSLSIILSRGGICIDQAYFAAESGKARGIPTMIFRGAGLDGWHAWFGFLDDRHQWQLDAGRYAEQRFLTGLAYDPQTWSDISDHELGFLTERFRRQPAYRISHVHTAFARDFLQSGDLQSARSAARLAVSVERRNLEGWEVLLTTAVAQNLNVVEQEKIIREAILALQRYPDLEAQLVRRLTDSLRARGQTSAADEEERRVAFKNRKSRADLSVQQAFERLTRSMERDPLVQQMRTYDLLLSSDGRGAGIDFFARIVTVFAEHLQRLGMTKEAMQALQKARSVLEIKADSQLDQQMRNLEKRLAG